VETAPIDRVVEVQQNLEVVRLESVRTVRAHQALNTKVCDYLSGIFNSVLLRYQTLVVNSLYSIYLLNLCAALGGNGCKYSSNYASAGGGGGYYGGGGG
jgi:uncharacterized membrane protein YgcG